MKIGVLLYTFSRVDDAKINLEIIRNLWSKNDLLKDVVVVHSFNGEKEWWPEKYLEDELLYLENPGHFEGAEILINEGIRCFSERYPEVDYVITLASDTWLLKSEYVENIILSMKKDKQYFATCTWGSKILTDIWSRGCALDFNVIDIKWAVKNGLFPIRFKEFKNKYEDLFFYNNLSVYLENVFMVRFLEAIKKSENIPSDNILKQIAKAHIYIMKEREPVHTVSTENWIFRKGGWKRTLYWPKIGLLTHHLPEPKRKALAKLKLKIGPNTEKFLNSRDLSYFNNGVGKTRYFKGKKEINYGD